MCRKSTHQAVFKTKSKIINYKLCFINCCLRETAMSNKKKHNKKGDSNWLHQQPTYSKTKTGFHTFQLTSWRFFSCMRMSLAELCSPDLLTFRQIVGSDPGFICRRWLGSNARVKQLSSKWTEQTINRPCGAKFFLCVRTNRTHFSLSVLPTGLICSAIPFCRMEPLLHPWTTHRLPPI